MKKKAEDNKKTPDTEDEESEEDEAEEGAGAFE